MFVQYSCVHETSSLHYRQYSNVSQDKEGGRLNCVDTVTLPDYVSRVESLELLPYLALPAVQQKRTLGQRRGMRAGTTSHEIVREMRV